MPHSRNRTIMLIPATTWPNHKNVAIYCRVSTVFASQEESLRNQKLGLAEMVNRNSHWSLVRIYEDKDSGGNTLRPGFRQMMSDAMNSADKSISLIDAALRRRFSFIEQKPDADLVKDKVLHDVLVNLNLNLVKELDSTDLLVGHSYFINKSENDLCDILNNNIIPLLYEYFYDNRKKVSNLLFDVIDKANANVKIIDETVGRLRVEVKGGANDSEQV